MSATMVQPATFDTGTEMAVIRSWKVPIALTVFTVLLAILLLLAPRDGVTTFRISTGNDPIQVPEIAAPVSAVTWTLFVVLVLLTALSAFLVRTRARVSLWIVGVYIFIYVIAFLTWAGAGATIPVTGLLAGSLGLAIPLIYGALCGVIGERSGVVNIAIEGQLLAGAFTAAIVATITQQPILGLLAAAVAGMLVAAVLSLFAIKYFV